MTETAELSPLERYREALEAFNEVNKGLPPGMQPMGLPPLLEPAAGLDALVKTLIDQGVIDQEAFVEAKAVRLVELVEAATEQAQELRRRAFAEFLRAAPK